LSDLITKQNKNYNESLIWRRTFIISFCRCRAGMVLRMRRWLALILVMGLLLGCTSVAPAEDRVLINLTRACFNLETPDPDQVKKVEDAINAYIADKINVEIRLRDLGSDQYGEQVQALMDSGEEINLLWTASWEDHIGTNELYSRGLVYDITDLLPGTALYGSLAKSHWEATRYGGRNYFIPVYKDNVEGYDVMFRKEVADAHGWDIDSVRTLEDLEPMLADAKADGLRYPYLTQNTSMFYRWYLDRFDFFTADVRTNFFCVDREKDEVIDTILTPEYASFAKLMARWAELGYISSDEINRVTTDTTTQSRDWAISWWTDVPVNSEASSRYGQAIVVQNVTGHYSHSNSALGSCYCVTANSTPEQAKAAADFLGLLYTDRKLADMYTFGIEGEDFEYTQIADQAIRHVTQHSSKYNHSMWESASATIVTPLADEPDIKDNLYVDFNCSAEISCASGFRFDKGPVYDQYEACKELFNQYGFLLENGGIPEADVEACIEEYQAALNAAGYQEVLREFQRQYREWKRTR